VIRDGRRPEKPGELEPAVAVRRAHHGNLDALVAKSSDSSGPLSFDRGPPFEIEAELAKESDRRFEIIDDDSYIVHPFKRHVSNLQGGHYSDNGPWGNCSEAVSTRCSHVSASRLCRRAPFGTAERPFSQPSAGPTIGRSAGRLRARLRGAIECGTARRAEPGRQVTSKSRRFTRKLLASVEGCKGLSFGLDPFDRLFPAQFSTADLCPV
jgi:hypothetical protein